jgi:hypothetical protein
MWDLFFVALVVWLFGTGTGWNRLFLDGDTGWHIRTGQHILETGHVPQHDLFSFSKAGAEWFAWEWLADVIYALLYGHWGLAGVAALSGVAICLTAALLLRCMIASGANAFPSGLLTLLFVGGASVHYHARPHVFTMLFLAAAVWMLRRDLERPRRAIWLLVPMTALWTNLHGGFLIVVAVAGLIAAGRLLEALLEGSRDWRPAARYGALAAACLAASLVNPFGWRLHQHIGRYLQSSFIQTSVQEFQSPSFRSESVFQYEGVLFVALAVCALAIRRKQLVWVLPVLYMAHASLGAARHIPLFMIVASPLIAAEATTWWEGWVRRWPRGSVVDILGQVSRDVGTGFGRWTGWAVAGIALVLALTPSSQWPSDFSQSFPRDLVSRHGERLASGKVFTTDQWGDYLIYRLYPRVRVFIDGRSDFYGEALAKEYLSLVELRSDWQSVLVKHGFNLILLPVDYSLSSALKLTSDWRVIEDNGKAILFERVPLAAVGKNHGTRPNGTDHNRRKY